MWKYACVCVGEGGKVRVRVRSVEDKQEEHIVLWAGKKEQERKRRQELLLLERTEEDVRGRMKRKRERMKSVFFCV